MWRQSLVIIAVLASSLWAEEPAFWQEHGIDFELVYTGEIMGSVSGGLQEKGGYLDNLDFKILYDGDKGNHKGWSANFYLIYNNGFDPSTYIGDAQTASNLEAPDTGKIYEAWVQRAVGDHALLFGLFDFNSEFDVIEAAGLFFNSSHGIGPDYSQAGLNGPSIFPTTSITLRYAWEHADGWGLRLAVADGVPGDPDDPKGTQIDWNSDEGLLNALELSRTGEAWKIAAGLWYVSGDFATENGVIEGNQGIYVLGEKDFGAYQVFGRLGLADKDLNDFRHYQGAGVVMPAPFGRRDDSLGLAVARVTQTGSNEVETNLELSWSIQMSGRLVLQPDLQYINNPGFSDLDDALVAAVRLQVTLF